MDKKVKYLAHYYDAPHDAEKRNCFLSACTKIEYIIGCLKNKGYTVEVLSACGTTGKNTVCGQVKRIDEKMVLEVLPHGGKGNKLQSIFSELMFRHRLYKRLNTFVCDGDTLLVYHSLPLMKPVQKLRAKKKINIILEVEEIYGDVLENKRITDKEQRYFKLADSYVFSTELLNQRINTEGKPHVIVYGTYMKVPEMDRITWDDHNIHCVYAGTLDPRKGVNEAIRAALFLPEGYHIHILGFGGEEDVRRIRELVERTSAQTKCKVTYDGVLSGNAYLRFLQSCDIGLSPQDPDASFNNTSFPSKILSYMSNGLNVVSIQIPAIMNSEISQWLTYYDKQTPEAIAEAIQSVDKASARNSCQIIQELDAEFTQKFYQIVNTFAHVEEID